MDKTFAALLGAVGALAASGPAQAADILHANSYADLLRPIPNAAAHLQALQDAKAAAPADHEAAPMLYEVRYDRHHHHHHHHHYVRRYYHHHHHHHVLARTLNRLLNR